MDIIEFYEKILLSFGLTVTSDGFIKSSDKPITINGKPFVVPTKDQIETLYAPNDRGEFVANKVIFNPLYERLTNDDSSAVKYLKKYIENKLILTYSILGNLLLKAYQSNSKELGNRISDFVILMNSAKTRNIKKLVDDTVEKKWKFVSNNMFKDSDFKPISISLKKSVIKDGERFYRGFVINSPLLETIQEDEHFKDSAKTRNIIKILITYLNTLINRDNDNIVSISSDSVSPTFMVILKAWFKIGTEFNKLIDELRFIDNEICNNIYFDLKFQLKDLNFEKFKNQAESLPYESNDGLIVEEEIPSSNANDAPFDTTTRKDDSFTTDIGEILKNADPMVNVQQEIVKAKINEATTVNRSSNFNQPNRIPVTNTYGQSQPVYGQNLPYQQQAMLTQAPQGFNPGIPDYFVRDPRTNLLFDRRINLLYDEMSKIYIDPATNGPVDPRIVENLLMRSQQPQYQTHMMTPQTQYGDYRQPVQGFDMGFQQQNSGPLKTRPGRRY